MSGFSLWPKVPQPQAQIVIDSLPELTQFAAIHGRVPDSEMKKVLAKNGLDCSLFQWRDEDSVPLESLAVNRQRVIWFCNEGFLASEKIKATQKELEEKAIQLQREERQHRAIGIELEREARDKARKAAAGLPRKVTFSFSLIVNFLLPQY